MMKRYGIVSLVVIFLSLLVISSVTAVPYANSNAMEKDTDVLEKIEKIINSNLLIFLQRVAEKHIDEEQKVEIKDGVSNILIKNGFKVDSTSYTIIGTLLIILAEIILFLLGHNPVGIVIAQVVTSLLAFICVAIIAIPFTPVTTLLIIKEIINKVVGSTNVFEWMIINFGILGTIIFLIIALPMFLICMVVGFVPVYISLVIEETIILIDEVNQGVQW